MIDMKKAQELMLTLIRDAAAKKASRLQKVAPPPTKTPSKYKGFSR